MEKLGFEPRIAICKITVLPIILFPLMIIILIFWFFIIIFFDLRCFFLYGLYLIFTKNHSYFTPNVEPTMLHKFKKGFILYR